MALISLVALILASIFGYSMGSVIAGRRTSVTPVLTDLLLIPILWIVGIMARDVLGRWLIVPAELFAGVLLGAFAISVRVRPKGKLDRGHPEPLLTRVGNFQSRLLLSLLYFVLFSIPGGIARLLRDPLGARRPPAASAWAPRQAASEGVEEARKQY